MESNQQTTKSLVRKLAEIVQEMDSVEKRGENKFQNYKYVKAADVAWAVRKALSERNIYLVSDMVHIRNYEIPAKEGVMQAVDVTMEFSFFDGDDPKTTPLVFHAYGTGTDKGDKAVYKAMTGALKYGLRHAFLIPDESDPEADESTDRNASQNETHGSQSQVTRPKPPKMDTAPAKQGESKPASRTVPNAPPANSSPDPAPIKDNGIPKAQIPAEAAPADPSSVPDKSVFDKYTARAVEMKIPLEKAGLRSSKGVQTGAKLKKFLLSTVNRTELTELTVADWEGFFAKYEPLVQTEPQKVVELIDPKEETK